MLRRIVLLLSSIFLTIHAQPATADSEYREGEVLVRFAPKENRQQRTKDEQNAILNSINAGTVKHFYKLVPGLTVVKLPEGLTVDKALAKFRSTGGILYAEPNYKLKPLSRPNDPDFNDLWGLHNTGQDGGTPDADIDAPQTWDIVTDSNVIVAVIDTGVDYNHPDLAANMWINTGEIPGNGIDDDGNGYIDDIYGYDFSTFGGKQRDSDPMDDYGHGTHCAGIIGAVGNNGVGVTGVCWHVKMMTLKFINYGYDPCEGWGWYGWDDDAIASIEYAVDKGAKVLSGSWGGDDYSQPLKDAINAAGTAGVLFIAAVDDAGNDNDKCPFYPASFDCDNIISVMATDNDDRRADQGSWASNWGATSVDLGAPGQAILSCWLNHSYQTMSGTSTATPFVAGAAALLWAKYPQFTNLEIKERILKSVDVLNSLTGLCVTGGRLNLYNMFAKDTAKAIKIAGGQNHTLVITQDKQAWAGGDNQYYQLGIGDTTISQTTPVHIHGYNNNGFLGDINDISAGWKHTLILDSNTSIYAVGNNQNGQLGDNQWSGQYYSPTPILVHGVNNSGYLKHIIAVSASQNGLHSLATDSNGLCYAWGLGDSGQLGQDGDHNNKLVPVQVKSGEMGGGIYLHDVNAVSAGEDHSMALDKYGFVYAWGQNSYDNGVSSSYKGRLGAGNTTAECNDLPVKVHAGQQNPGNPNSALSNIADIAAGWNHCVALEDIYPLDPNRQGRVYTWGWGGSTSKPNTFNSDGGRLGNGSTTNQPMPVLVKAGEQDPNNPNAPLEMIVGIAAGEGHTMFLTIDGHVLCTGDNTYGELGNGQSGTGKQKTTPVKVHGWNNKGYLENIVAIAAGGWHSLAIDADGTVWAWGRCSNYGQLGLGRKVDVNTPQPVHPVYNLTKQNFCFAIQTAVNDANNGDVIEASKGTYYEVVHLGSKPLTLQSADPNNPNVVAETVMSGKSDGVSSTVDATNNPGSKIRGLTFASNTSYLHRGIDCYASYLEVNKCVFKGDAGGKLQYGMGCFTQWSGLYINDCNISGATLYGLQCEESNCTVAVNNSVIKNCREAIFCNTNLDVNNCEITGNHIGISCGVIGDVTVNAANCIVANNQYAGFLFGTTTGVSPSISVHNNVIRNNGWGITFGGDWPSVYYARNTDIEVADNLIYGNRYDGIRFTFGNNLNKGDELTFLVRNNTIADNNNGVYVYWNAAYDGDEYLPDVYITNCILWDNDVKQIDDAELLPDYSNGICYVTFSCIEGGYVGYENISSDPCLVPGDSYYHLGPNSPCIDSGDPCGNYVGETDIDGEPRIMNGRVDIGSDEYSSSFNCGRADFNHDLIVNFFDYTVLAKAWLTQLGGAGYNEICDLVNDNLINQKDLKVFCMDCWLWQMPIGVINYESMMAQQESEDLVSVEGGEEGAFAQSTEVQPEQLLVEAAAPVDVEGLLNWFDEIWNTGELNGIMTESEYLEFRNTIGESGEQVF